MSVWFLVRRFVTGGGHPRKRHWYDLEAFDTSKVIRVAGVDGRMLTVDLNGTTVVCYREIPGITGGVLDSAEGQPGPLLLQGDHGPIEYRNIVITPARSVR